MTPARVELIVHYAHMGFLGMAVGAFAGRLGQVARIVVGGLAIAGSVALALSPWTTNHMFAYNNMNPSLGDRAFYSTALLGAYLLLLCVPRLPSELGWFGRHALWIYLLQFALWKRLGMSPDWPLAVRMVALAGVLMVARLLFPRVVVFSWRPDRWLEWVLRAVGRRLRGTPA